MDMELKLIFYLFLIFIETIFSGATENECEGGNQGLRTAWSGAIETAHFGSEPYKNSQSCEWTILVPQGNLIHVHFTFFVLEPGIVALHGEVQCWDQLEIFDGEDRDTHSLGIFCGEEIQNDIISSTNALTFLFESSHETTYPGFKLLYTGISTGLTHDLSRNPTKFGYLEVPMSQGVTIPSDYIIITSSASYIFIKIHTPDIPCHTSIIRVVGENPTESETQDIQPSCSPNHHILGFISSFHRVHIYIQRGSETVIALSYISEFLPCMFHSCLANQSCTEIPSEDRETLVAKCLCPFGFTGHDCSEDVDECAGNPCGIHGASCIDGIGFFNCSCKKGFIGDFCEYDIDECVNSPCIHGNCENLPGYYICKCLTGYQGTFCDKENENEEPLEISLPVDINSTSISFTSFSATDRNHSFLPEILYCPEEITTIGDLSIKWNLTVKGQNNIQPCPLPLQGNASRRCLFSNTTSTPTWESHHISNCTSEDFLTLSQMISALPNANETEVENVVEEILTLLQNSTSESSNAGLSGTPALYTGDLIIATNAVKAISDMTQSYDLTNILEVTEIVSDVVDVIIDPAQKTSWQYASDKISPKEAANDIFDTMENLARSVVKAESINMPHQLELREFLLIRDNFEMDILIFPTNISNNDSLLLEAEAARSLAHSQSYVQLPQGIIQPEDDAFVAIYWARYSSLADVLFAPTSDVQLDNIESDFVNSDIQSVVIIGVDEEYLQNLSEPMEAVFKLHSPAPEVEPTCVFLTGTAWNTSGCYPFSNNATHTVCHCNHLTNFAVLMDIHDTLSHFPKKHKKALSMLSIIGGSLSILGCVLTVVLFEFLRLKSDRIRIHEQLALAIAASQALFIFGITRTEHELVCKVIGIVLHYFLEAMFVWMLIEGMNLYIALVKVFNTSTYFKKYFIVGWGLPAVIVGVTVGMLYDSYGTDELCWMTSDAIMMGFMPTIIVVIMLNMIVLITVLHVLIDSMSAKFKSTAEQDAILKVGMALKASFVLLPILGLTWIFGFISISSATMTFTYIFAITSSLQGFFFFIAHCLLNLEVRQAFLKRFGFIPTSSWASTTTRSTVRATTKKLTSHKNVRYFMTHRYKEPGDMTLFNPYYDDINFITYDENQNEYEDGDRFQPRNLILLEDSEDEFD